MLTAIALCLFAIAAPDQTATGYAFLDADGDGVRDASEPSLPGVRISNGRDVVRTDALGRYELTVDDDDIIFVIKPRNYRTRIDDLNLPRFYYIHKPAGSPAPLEHAGVDPTGPLPESVDFPLYEYPEPDTFDIILLGDPQPRNVQEVHFYARDIVDELIGSDAALAMALGDIAFDDPSTYGPYNEVNAAIGCPVYNVYGNHDQNYDVTEDRYADETWERTFGPPTFSFDVGPVHFIALDDVMYDGHEKRGRYHAELTDEQLAFIENDLALVDPDQLIVLAMHIPVTQIRNRDRLFALLAEFPNTFSVSAHAHTQRHEFLDAEDGWPGEHPHHHLVHVTACGSWWSGATDEYGVPHTQMADGAPNGYSLVTFDGAGYSIRWKTARRPETDQMSIFAPDAVAATDAGDTQVLVNVFAGSERSHVRMRIDGGPWRDMARRVGADPYYVRMKALEESDRPPNGREMADPAESHHLWAGSLPPGLALGPHVIHVRTTDMFGQTYEASRVLRVE